MHFLTRSIEQKLPSFCPPICKTQQQGHEALVVGNLLREMYPFVNFRGNLKTASARSALCSRAKNCSAPLKRQMMRMPSPFRLTCHTNTTDGRGNIQRVRKHDTAKLFGFTTEKESSQRKQIALHILEERRLQPMMKATQEAAASARRAASAAVISAVIALATFVLAAALILLPR